jgi:hypothetical protein
LVISEPIPRNGTTTQINRITNFYFHIFGAAFFAKGLVILIVINSILANKWANGGMEKQKPQPKESFHVFSCLASFERYWIAALGGEDLVS